MRAVRGLAAALLFAAFFALRSTPADAAVVMYQYDAAAVPAYEALAQQLLTASAFFVPTGDLPTAEAIERQLGIYFLGNLNFGYTYQRLPEGLICIPASNAQTIQKEAQAHYRAKAALDALVQKSAALPETERLKFYHDFLCTALNYDYPGYEKQRPAYRSVADALEHGLSVCDGYVKAFYYLCGASGIPVRYVTNGPHAWNEVFTGGKWLKVDVTWDDCGWGYTYFLVPVDYR